MRYFETERDALAHALRLISSPLDADELIKAAHMARVAFFPGVQRVSGNVYSASRASIGSSAPACEVVEERLPALRTLIARLTEEAAPSLAAASVPANAQAKATAP
jgi:hypothetical protein